MTHSLLQAGAILLAAFAAAPATAQDYPTRDITAIVGFPAGSGADVYARFFANKLSQAVKQNVVVMNRPGANSSIATEAVARAKPDGYTLFFGGSDAFGSPLYLFKKPSTDPRKDFTYISPLLGQAFILVVASDKPIKTVAELTAYLKQKGDKANYASTNNPAIILAEMYKKAAGIDTVEVKYKTSMDFVNDMLEGRIDFVMADPVFGLARIREGKMRPLGVSTAKRISTISDIPTLQEAGVPGVDMNLWWLAAGPANMPPAVAEKLNAVFTEIGKQADVREFLGKNGGEPFIASLAETKRLVEKEIADWEGYVKLAKIEAQ